MATCARCGRYLDTDHRCRGMWRLKMRVGRTILAGVVVGGLLGFATMVAIYRTVSVVTIAICMLIGGSIAVVYVRGEPR